MNRLAFIWGFSEATFFFIIPDILFSGLAINHVKKAAVTLIYAVFGALIGGTLLYFLPYFIDASLLKKYLISLPFLSEAMVETIDKGMAFQPYQTLFTSGFIGIPYKVYAVFSGLHQLNFFLFLGISLIMRFFRFSTTLLITFIGSFLLKRYVSLRIVYVVWLSLVILFYGSYFIILSFL